MKDVFGMPIIGGKREYPEKQVIDYINRNRRAGDHQEFRLVIHTDGSAYIHEMDKDSETLNFQLNG